MEQQKTQLKPTNNLRKLHESLLKKNGFNVPYEAFEQDMQDQEKLKRLHENLSKEDGFNVPYDKFKSDMFVSGEAETPEMEVPEQPEQNELPEQVIPTEQPQGQGLSFEPEKPKAPDYMGLISAKDKFKMANERGVSTSFLDEVGKYAAQAERPTEYIFDVKDLNRRLDKLPEYFPYLEEQASQLKQILTEVDSQTLPEVKEEVERLEASVMQLRPAGMMMGQQSGGDPMWAAYEREVIKNPSALATKALLDRTKEVEESVLNAYEHDWGIIEKAGRTLEGVGEGLKTYIKGYGQFWDDIAGNQAVKELQKKIAPNTEEAYQSLDTDERILLKAMVDNWERYEQLGERVPMSYKIGKTTGESLGFMAEFMMTFGVGGGVAAGIRGAAAGASKAVRLSASAVAKVAQAGIQTSAMPALYKNTALDVSKGDNFGMALLNNYWELGAENLSERIFMANPGSLKSLNTADAMFRRMGVNMSVEKGWTGLAKNILEEATEEKLSEIMTAPKDHESFKSFWKSFTDKENNSIMFGSVSLMVGLPGVATVGGSKATKVYDDVKFSRISKQVVPELRSELDIVFEDKSMPVKEQFEMAERIITDKLLSNQLEGDPGTAAAGALRYSVAKAKKTQQEFAENLQEEQLKYLNERGVKVPDGTNMTQLGEMFEKEQKKEQAEKKTEGKEVKKEVKEETPKVENEKEVIERLENGKEIPEKKSEISEKNDSENIKSEIVDQNEGQLTGNQVEASEEVAQKEKFPETENETSSQNKQLEEKKTDIERKRQDALGGIMIIDSKYRTRKLDKDGKNTLVDVWLLTGETENELKDKLNAKYDAELAALESDRPSVESEKKPSVEAASASRKQLRADEQGNSQSDKSYRVNKKNRFGVSENGDVNKRLLKSSLNLMGGIKQPVALFSELEKSVKRLAELNKVLNDSELAGTIEYFNAKVDLINQIPAERRKAMEDVDIGIDNLRKMREEGSGTFKDRLSEFEKIAQSASKDLAGFGLEFKGHSGLKAEINRVADLLLKKYENVKNISEVTPAASEVKALESPTPSKSSALEQSQIEETAKTKRQVRMEEIDSELGDAWSDLADIVGAKKNLTGEQQQRLAPVVAKVAKLYAEKGLLKGAELIEAVVEYFKAKGITLDENLIKTIDNGITRDVGSLRGTEKVQKQQQQQDQGKDEKGQAQKESKQTPEARTETGKADSKATEKKVVDVQALRDRVSSLEKELKRGNRDAIKKMSEVKAEIIDAIKAELKDSSISSLRRAQATQLLNKAKRANEKNIAKITDEAVKLIQDFREKGLIKELTAKIDKALSKPVIKKENKRNVGKTVIPVQHYVSKAKEAWNQMRLLERQANIVKESYISGTKGEKRKAQELLYEQHQAESLQKKRAEFDDYVNKGIEDARKKQENDNEAISEQGVYEEIALIDMREAFNAGSSKLTEVLGNINRTLKEGKGRFSDKIKKDADRRKEIKKEAVEATESELSGLNEAEIRKRKITDKYKFVGDFMKDRARAVTGWMYQPIKTSLEYMLKYIESGKHRMEDGPIYKRFFMSDEGYMNNRSNRKRDHDALFGEIRDKFKELTGKKSRGTLLASLSDPKSNTGIRLIMQDNPFSLTPTELGELNGMTKENVLEFVDRVLNSKELTPDQKHGLNDFKKVFAEAAENKKDDIISELINALEGRDIIDEVMSQGEALYIYSALKMDGVRENYERQGFDEKAIRQLEEFAGKDLLAFADWVQSEFLPNLHKNKYDLKHQEIYNATLDFIKNYFPLRYDETGLLNKSKDLSIGEFSFFMPSVTSNHLKSRVNNTHGLSRTANYFDVLFGYVESMEKWYHYSALTKDFNAIISDKQFVNNINLGDSKMLDDLIGAFERATEQHSRKLGSEDVIIANATRGIAAANITFRIWTALKQPVSALAWLEKAAPSKVADVFVPLLGSGKFLTKMLWNMNPVTNYLNHKFLYKESALYRNRVDSRDAGYEDMHQGFMAVKTANRKIKEGALRRYLIAESWKLPVKIGMAPNVFLDAYTIAAGGRVYYEQQLKEYQKIMEKEEAHKKAIRDFDLAFNQVQQSAESAFLAGVQSDKTAIKSFFSVYKTSQFSYLRKFMQGSIDLMNGYSRERDKWEKRYISQGFSKENASKKARRKGLDYLGTKNAGDDVKKLVLYGWVLPLAWEYVSSGLPGLMTGWDDDDESKLMRALYLGPLDYTFAMADVAKVAYNWLILGEKWYDWQPSVLVSKVNELLSDMAKAFEESGETNNHVAREIVRVMLITRGVDIENIGNIYDGAVGLMEEGRWDKESWFKLMNAPKSFSRESAPTSDDSDRPQRIITESQKPQGARPERITTEKKRAQRIK